MTFKAWLLHMIKSTSDADIAVAKALRYMLKVKKLYFSQKNHNEQPFTNRFVLPKR